MNQTMTDYWESVEEAVKTARLIAWDTCHKIYLAMDEEQEAWFVENYSPDIFRGTPEEMLTTLRSWYEQSCPLKFIDSVETNHENQNYGFESLIPQGAEDDWDDEDEDEDDDWDDED